LVLKSSKASQLEANSSTFRDGFYAGLLLAVAAGTYLFQLWQPERQVKLHSQHLVSAFKERDKEALEGFIDLEYQDQWGHDRAQLVSRLDKVLRYTRDLQIQTQGAWVEISRDRGEWHARITVEGEPSEVNTLIAQHVNAVSEPFELQWRRRSWKPWDWKLVRVTNTEFQLPAGMPF